MLKIKTIIASINFVGVGLGAGHCQVSDICSKRYWVFGMGVKDKRPAGRRQCRPVK